MKKKISYFGATALLITTAMSITSCGNGSSDSNNRSSYSVKNVYFEPLSIAKTDAEKKQVRISPKFIVEYENGVKKEYPLSYKIVTRSGSLHGNWQIGTLYDKNLQPLREVDGSPIISNNPDADSLLEANGKKYLVTHFEEPPGALYKTELDSNGNAVSTHPVDLKNIGGTIINCAGTKSPWNTHLGAEEDYSLNSRYADPASPYYVDCDIDSVTGYFTGTAGGSKNYFCSYVAGMQKYLHDINIDKNNGYNGNKFSPYNYGYIVEVHIKDDGTTEVAKHYVTGKYTPETTIVMPDNKTLYITDDGTAKGLYKLVLDNPINGFAPNWSGTLYIAKLIQTSAENGGQFDIKWIELGHASDNEIKQLIDRKLKLSDIFEIGDINNCDTNNGFKLIYEDSELLCLKLKTGTNRSSKFASDDEVKKAAAFLETRKYGAYLGGTTEFRKEEGITYNPDKNVVYIAMSAIEKSMEDNYKGIEPVNHIRLPKNKCGGIYEMSLDSKYNGVKLKSILVGKPLEVTDPDYNKYADEYYCHPDSIANPDNIMYIGNGILLIGEDTSKHVNNMVWSYDVNKKELTRIATVPTGGEVTGNFGRGLVGSKYTLWFNVQHPFDDIFTNAKGGESNVNLINNATDEDKKGIIGYIEGIPAGIFKY